MSSLSDADDSQLSPSWWCTSVESVLNWSSLQSYNIVPASLIAVIEADEADIPTRAYALTPLQQPEPYASISLPEHVTRNSLPTRGALDDHAELSQLVDRFLGFIHAKQPVIDPAMLHHQISVVSEEGLGWDAATCLLLLACALGGICTPYNQGMLEDFSTPTMSAEQFIRSHEYFDAGRKRLGLVMGRASEVGAQCLFLAAGFYMTIFEPVAAWRNMNAASAMCNNMLAKTGEKPSLSTSEKENKSQDGSSTRTTSLRKLFWSCLKTEREVAAELGLDIASQQLLPYSETWTFMPGTEDPPGRLGEDAAHSTPPGLFTSARSPAQQHEQTWLYYLTDISLRKLEIQIEAFFKQQQQLNAKSPSTRETSESFYSNILDCLLDLDRQLMSHFDNLPTTIDVHQVDGTGHSPDDLREYLRLRMLIIRSTLNRPALHFIVHDSLQAMSAPLKAQAAQMANCALSINMYLVTQGLTTHRHPGTWLGIRYCTRAVLELFAAAKSGAVGLPGGLVLPDQWQRDALPRLERAFVYWGAESKDVRMYLGWIERLQRPAWE